MPITLQDFKADVFRALANPVRIHILERLRIAGRLTVGEISESLEIAPANASQHLAVLRGRGLVQASRDGTSVWYEVADPELFALLDAARALFEKRLQLQTELLATEPPRSRRRPAR